MFLIVIQHIPISRCEDKRNIKPRNLHKFFFCLFEQSLTSNKEKNSKQETLTLKSIQNSYNRKMNNTFLGRNPILAVLIGAFIISFSGIWVSLADVSPTSSGFYRVFFGFIFLLFATLKNRDFQPISRKKGCLIVLCALFFAVDLFCWHASIGYIGPGLATIIGNFQVFIIAAIGIVFLGEVIRLRFLISIPLAVLGLFLVVGINWQQLGEDYKLGVYLGLATAVCYTGFLLILRKIQSDGSAMSFYYSLMLISLVCSIFMGLTVLLNGDTFAIPDITSLVALVCLGLFSQTIGWLLIANAMPKIKASLTGLILLLQPTLAFIWDVIIFQRPTDLINWVGVSLTLVAIYLGVTGNSKQNTRSRG